MALDFLFEIIFFFPCMHNLLPLTNMYSHHVYEGKDVQYHGPQELKIPGPAMDDVFNHVMVEDYQNGDLRIRRLVDGVLQLPNWRTCGHVRCLVNADGDFPEIKDCIPDTGISPKPVKQDLLTEGTEPTPVKINQESKKFQTPSPKCLHEMKTPSPASDDDSYAEWVARIDVHGNKNRTPLRCLPVNGMKVARWATIKSARSLRAFEGYDNLPLRQLSNSRSRSAAELVHGKCSPQGKIVKVAAPGAIWKLPVAGDIVRLCCLNGFQVKSGPFFSLMTRAENVENLVGRPMPEEVDLADFVKIKVDDLFENGSPELQMVKAVRETGEQLSKLFLDKVPKWEDWRDLELVTSAAYDLQIRLEAARQLQLMQDKKAAKKLKEDKAEEKRAAVKRRQQQALAAAQAAKKRKEEARKKANAAQKAARQRQAAIKKTAMDAARNIQRTALTALEKKLTAAHKQTIKDLQKKIKDMQAKHEEQLRKTIEEIKKLKKEAADVKAADNAVATVKEALRSLDQGIYCLPRHVNPRLYSPPARRRRSPETPHYQHSSPGNPPRRRMRVRSPVSLRPLQPVRRTLEFSHLHPDRVEYDPRRPTDYCKSPRRSHYRDAYSPHYPHYTYHR